MPQNCAQLFAIRIPREAAPKVRELTLDAEQIDNMRGNATPPVMTGKTSAQRVQGTPRVKDMRIVIYSTDTRHATVIEAKPLVALNFLVKGPVGFAKLVECIYTLAGEIV
jgi:DNA-binding NarL/FixJ family response regulator